MENCCLIMLTLELINKNEENENKKCLHLKYIHMNLGFFSINKYLFICRPVSETTINIFIEPKLTKNPN